MDDMVASGRLMASFENERSNLPVLPNVPLLSLIQWALETVEDYSDGDREYEVADTSSNIVQEAFATGPITGKKFKSVLSGTTYLCAMCTRA